MPPQPLVERALAAAIVVLLTVAGVVALAGGRGPELALGVERAAAADPAPSAAADAVDHRRATPVPAARTDVLASTVTAPTSVPEAATTTTVLATAPVVSAAPTTQPAPTTTAAPAPTAPPPTAAPPTTSPPTTAASAPPAGTTRDGACESSMLGWMNEARSQAGRGPLAEDEAIQHVSLDWSGHMASTGELAHNPRFSDQIFAVRAEATTAGEVVGWSSESARAVFDEFMRSSLHRDTIRQPAFRYATVGCVRDAGGRLWVTADFWG